jgi:hypothetical protein
MKEWDKNDGSLPEEVVLVNDTSDSMNASDWKPSRLAGAKEAVTAL